MDLAGGPRGGRSADQATCGSSRETAAASAATFDVEGGYRLRVGVLTGPGDCRRERRPGDGEDAVFYTMVAFILEQRLGVLKPGTEWISTVRRSCSAVPRPTLIP